MTQAAGVLSELYTVHYRPAARRHGYQSSIKHILQVTHVVIILNVSARSSIRGFGSLYTAV